METDDTFFLDTKGKTGANRFDDEVKRGETKDRLDFLFLPAAKPTGHRTVRVDVVVVVVVVGGGDYFEVMTLNPRSTFFLVEVNFNFFPPSCFPTQNFLRGGIHLNRSRFVSIMFSHPKFSSGWDPGLFDQISLRGGIQGSFTRILFGVGSVT